MLGLSKKNRARWKDDGKEKACMCAWEAESEIVGEKKRRKMKGVERLGGSCESKCGRERIKRK